MAKSTVLRKIWRLTSRVMLAIVCLIILVPPIWVFALRNGPVAPTRLMQNRYDERAFFVWTPLAKIPVHIQQAVLLAEDPKFCYHHGFDWAAMNQAITAARQGQKLVGASSLSQQVAKNVFLWPKRSWLRKGLETWFTYLIEKIWTKPRILEVYLNIASWGQGVFGVAAAAQSQFAFATLQDVTPQIAAQLAVQLPNPDDLSLAPDARSTKRAQQIQGLLKAPDLELLIPCLIVSESK
jgi:monofunctional glycosyltransferase